MEVQIAEEKMLVDVESSAVRLELEYRKSPQVLAAFRIRCLLVAMIGGRYLWHCYLVHRQAELYASHVHRPAVLRNYVTEHQWEQSRLKYSDLSGFTLEYSAMYLYSILALLLWPYVLGARNWLWRALCCVKKRGHGERGDEGLAKVDQKQGGDRSLAKHAALFIAASVALYVSFTSLSPPHQGKNIF